MVRVKKQQDHGTRGTVRGYGKEKVVFSREWSLPQLLAEVEPEDIIAKRAAMVFEGPEIDWDELSDEEITTAVAAEFDAGLLKRCRFVWVEASAEVRLGDS